MDAVVANALGLGVIGVASRDGGKMETGDNFIVAGVFTLVIVDAAADDDEDVEDDEADEEDDEEHGTDAEIVALPSMLLATAEPRPVALIWG